MSIDPSILRDIANEIQARHWDTVAKEITRLAQRTPCMIAGDERVTFAIDAMERQSWEWQPTRSRLVRGSASVVVARSADGARGPNVGAVWLCRGSDELRTMAMMALRMEPMAIYDIATTDDIVERLRALADEQNPRPKGAAMGRVVIDVNLEAVERATQQLQAAAERMEAACERVESLTGGSSAGAMGEALRKLMAEEVFGPIVARAQARKDGQP